jgi:gluconokinase
MIVLVMGVAGAGKSTIGAALAQRLGWRFIDADDYHPPQNVAKMKAGIPLDDADRWPWLHGLNKELRTLQMECSNAVLACSALKKSYRERLARGIHDFRIIYLRGSRELIGSRMAKRTHRYMAPTLLESQFTALEPPTDAISIDVAAPPQECVAAIVGRLAETRKPG